MKAIVLLALLCLSALATAETSQAVDDEDPTSVDAGAARAEGQALVANRRFCKEGSGWLLGPDRRWCDHVDGERCPGMKAACAKPEKPDEHPFVFPHIPGLEAVPWIVVILGILVLIYAMARRFAPGSSTLDGAATDGDATSAEVSELEHSELARETNVDRLLNRAAAAMARADADLALAFLHAALLRVLASAGLHLDRSKTNGDYVRELRGRPELGREVARIMALIERAQFGHEPPSPTLFKEALAVVRRLAYGTLLALLLAMTVAASACGDFGSDRASSRGAALAFLKAHNTEIVRRQKTLDQLSPTDDAILLMADATLSAPQITALLKWVKGGGVLVVAGHKKTLTAFGLTTIDQTEHLIELLTEGDTSLRLAVPGRQRLVASLEVVSRYNLSPLIGSMQSSYILRGWPGEGRVLLLADDDLITDGALVSGDDAALLQWLFQQLPEKLQLVDDLTGVSPPMPPSSLMKANLLPVFAQLVVVLVLFGLMRGTAFGRRRDPPVARRRRFVEHVLACAAIYARGRVGRYALGLYANLAIEQLRQRVRPRGAALSELAEAISHRTGRSLGQVMSILVEAQEASQPSSTTERSDAPLDLMRALAQLLHHTGGSKP